jgi:hypothetical protein
VGKTSDLSAQEVSPIQQLKYLPWSVDVIDTHIVECKGPTGTWTGLFSKRHFSKRLLLRSPKISQLLSRGTTHSKETPPSVKVGAQTVLSGLDFAGVCVLTMTVQYYSVIRY